MREEVLESEDSFENDPNRDVEYQLMVMADRARTVKIELDLQRGIVEKVVKENEKIILQNERLEVINLILKEEK
jgi:hypothetical protein